MRPNLYIVHIPYFKYSTYTLVFFKRLGSRGFHDLFCQYIVSIHKRYAYYKTAVYANFEPRSLDDFHEYKMPIRLYNGKNP